MRTLRPSCLALFASLLVIAAPAAASPVCTDGYKGGPPRTECGGRIFPESTIAKSYVQFTPDPSGFAEYQNGLEYLASQYPRWISAFTLADKYGKDAVSAGPDKKRPYEQGDSGDGRQIPVVRITDRDVPDAGKKTLFFSLSVHGNERGGLEGGVRTAEDLAMAAVAGGKITDGVPNYESTTGRDPVFHDREVRDVLAKEIVYLVDFNVDGWAIGDIWNTPVSQPYTRGNSIGTDLNRQMPTIGRIDQERNPLTESEMIYGHKLMHEVAAAGEGGRMAHGTDVHGELNSQAYVDIMYPAGEFDSVQHRRLMAIAERTKSVIDKTLYQGIADEIETANGGNDAEGSQPVIPSKPAHWANVWDTLGYTDTGFIGDYMATDLAVTGMDYEFFLNHTVPDRVWNTYLQENHINGTRALIKTAMAYALFQEEEFNDHNVVVDSDGQAGYVFNPATVTDKDANGPGTLPGPKGNGIGANGKPVEQRPYSATNMKWFADESRLMPDAFVRFSAADIARDSSVLDAVDTLVLADDPAPADAAGRPYDRDAYFRNIRAWIARGGNLVLTDRALHALASLDLVPAAAVKDIKVYQPYANIKNFAHPMVQSLRPNARQLVEAAILGYAIGNSASPMTIVDRAAWEKLGGKVVATTGDGAGSSDDGSQVSLGQASLGDGQIRVVGAALPTPTETNDHRYGLRNYALTYSGTFVMENSIKHNVRGLGMSPVAAATVQTSERLRLQLSYARRRLRSALRHGILVAAWCRARCALRGRLTLAGATARRYGFRGVTVASGRSRRAVRGRALIRLRFGRVAQRRLRNARALGLKLTITGREVAGGRTTRLSRVVNLLR